MQHDVVLGLGGCLDYEVVWDAATVQDLAARHDVRLADIGAGVVVRSERDLVRSVLGFVRDGVGGERFVASSDIVEAFASQFDRRVTLGGTNVRAAVAMSRLGVASTLHLVSIDDSFRRLLPPQVSYVCSAEADSRDPHLIVQFPAGATVRLGDAEIRSPRPNRLIYVNDRPNRELPLSPALGDVLATASVLLLSGFNSMQDADLVARRVRELREHMRRLPPGALVVYEDAGFHVPELSALVREGILDVVDVYGLNEDELQAYVGHPVRLLDATAVAGALQELQAVVPARTLVVHTRHWSLAHGPQAGRFREALRLATAVAGARYVAGDDFTAADVRAVDDRTRHPEGAAFARAVEARIPGQVSCVAALLLESSTPTTVGLGDAFVGGFVAALAPALAERSRVLPHADRPR
jgi:ADP-dependent phosphofructokinase/glucokinase